MHTINHAYIPSMVFAHAFRHNIHTHNTLTFIHSHSRVSPAEISRVPRISRLNSCMALSDATSFGRDISMRKWPKRFPCPFTMLQILLYQTLFVVTRQQVPVPGVNTYSVTFTTPSKSSLGAMPLGNGRSSCNTWVDPRGDILLNVGLADALDENSNLLKLGLIRIQMEPALNTSALDFNQTLVLDQATVTIRADGVHVSVWVDANTSSIRATFESTKHPVRVTAWLDHKHRINNTINAANFGNGWGGKGGSFCFPNGSIATFVGIYPDRLHTITNAVAWYHRNDPNRSDMFGNTLRQQGLSDCGPECWDPLTNRSFGATLVGDASFVAVNATGITTEVIPAFAGGSKADIAVAVTSGQTVTEEEFLVQLDQAFLDARQELVPANAVRLRGLHEAWWSDFFNRSWVHVTTPASVPTHPPKPFNGANYSGYRRYDHFAGVQAHLIRQPGWPHHGEFPGNCKASFHLQFDKPLDNSSRSCVAHAAKTCDAVPGCVAFALSHSWASGFEPQLFTVGLPGLPDDDGWALFISPKAPPPAPEPTAGFLVSRQNILMRYMDVCSSGRIGGGPNHSDYFALKYNGGILTSEEVPKEDFRSWGAGQWWQNLRLPYYAMLAEGGADIFKPLLRWYLAMLPLAKRRTQLWFNETDAAGRDLRGKNVTGAWFIETSTQFGTFLPAEKGYHCAETRNVSWTVDWAGNAAINLHREGSVELLMLALDYYDYTLDKKEFQISILPLGVAITDFVRTYYGRTASGLVDIWPTQSLEGYRPGGFPPTHNNTVRNDQPWVSGLHAVLPRLIRIAIDNNVSAEQILKWHELLSILPPLPVHSNGSSDYVFTAAQTPYPPHSQLGGSEQPYMYPVHPYRLATVMNGGELLNIGRQTMISTGKSNFGHGWQQGVMNVALLGWGEMAAEAVLQRALTQSGAMRFPTYLPSMQDFRPNEDHLSNMRSALQYMILQHSDHNQTLGLLPAWPCANWSVSFKLHAPAQTTIEGSYDHETATLHLHVVPESRLDDVFVLDCAKHIVHF